MGWFGDGDGIGRGCARLGGGEGVRMGWVGSVWTADLAASSGLL
jgi:hypothetical protein